VRALERLRPGTDPKPKVAFLKVNRFRRAVRQQPSGSISIRDVRCAIPSGSAGSASLIEKETDEK
jgi:hypothetical protein